MENELEREKKGIVSVSPFYRDSNFTNFPGGMPPDRTPPLGVRVSSIHRPPPEPLRPVLPNATENPASCFCKFLSLFFLLSFPQAHGNEAGQVEEGGEFYYSAKQYITEHVAHNTHDTANSAKASWLTLCSILPLFQGRFLKMLTSVTALLLINSLPTNFNLTRPTGMQFPRL